MLAELEVTSNLFRVNFEELVEVASGGVVIPQLHALERETMPGKGIAGLIGNELLEDLATRFLCIEHGISRVL